MDDQGETEAIRQVSERFYAAVGHILRGEPGPMLALWSQAADTTYIDPRGGIQQGWEAIRAYWEQAATANRAATARLSARAEVLALGVSGELAYTVGIVQVDETVDDHVTPMQARETNVYRREAGEWRMVHRHAEPTRVLSPAEGR